MFSEVAVVSDLDYIVGVLWVSILEMLKNSKLNTSLMLIPLFIFDDLEPRPWDPNLAQNPSKIQKIGSPKFINVSKACRERIFTNFK